MKYKKRKLLSPKKHWNKNELPKGWKIREIGKLCTFSSGHGFNKKDWKSSGLPIIRIQNLNGNSQFNYFSGKPDPSWVVLPGEILFAWAGVKGVSFGPTVWNGPKGVLNQHIYKVRPNVDVDPKWLFLMLDSITHEIERKAHGFKSSLLHVHKREITDKLIPYPPISEQQIIAEVISNWSAAIFQFRKLISAKKDRRKALMQKMLTGKVRLKEYQITKRGNQKYPSDWQVVKIKDLFKPIKRKNSEGCERILTASGRRGLIAQDDYFNRSIGSQSLHKYFLLQKGEFAYNRSSMNDYAYGAIKRLDKYDKGILSTLYICFSLIDQCNCSDFYKHFFENNSIAHELSSIVQVGARAHGLLNVSQNDFFQIKIPKPCIAEQSEIAKIMDKADSEIANLEKNIFLLEKQKRGLMQKLLTGEVRVNS
jgi:type I restriction enzyme S subunit